MSRDPILNTMPPPVPPPSMLPPPPELVRQETQNLAGEIFEIKSNGLDEYTLEDYENVARNNGWYLDMDAEAGSDWEREELTDSDSDSDSDLEEDGNFMMYDTQQG